MLQFFRIGKDSGRKPVDWNEMSRHLSLEYSYIKEVSYGIFKLDNVQIHATPAVNCTKEGNFGAS